VWCSPKTSHIVMDTDLCKEFARTLDFWIETARQHAKNAEFYRGLIDQCAEYIGEEAYTAAGGRVHDSPIRLKVPELVKQLVYDSAFFKNA